MDMTIRILDSVTEPGSSVAPNEDVMDAVPAAAWVIDGATGLGKHRLTKDRTDAEWLAQESSAYLRKTADWSDPSVENLVRGLITHVAASFTKLRAGELTPRYTGRDELPSAGLVLVRSRPGGVQIASLGDCRAILVLPDGTVACSAESRLSELDRSALEEMDRKLPSGGKLPSTEDVAAARTAIQPTLQANRALLNTPSGYWVLSIHPEAADHLQPKDFLLATGTRARGLLASDGFYRLVDPFGECRDDTDLVEQTLRFGPKRMLERLRSIEERDAGCRNFRRFKPKDDATVMTFEVLADPPGARAMSA
jgi:hypothetical protein